jgi:hypothetical protein
MTKASYLPIKGATTRTWGDGSGDFYVMFAGSLINTEALNVANGAAVTPSASTGYISPHFTADTNMYTKANYATYHKFTYTAAYA